MVRVNAAIGFAMKRVALKPFSVSSVAIVNVVAATLLSASSSIRNLLAKAWVTGVFAKAQRISYAHCVDEVTTTAYAPIVAAAADNPIFGGSAFANRRFARGKCAIAVERIWCKSAVVANYVGVQSQLPPQQR